MPTRLDVIQTALRRIQVLSADEPADADMVAYAGDLLDGLFAEAKEVQGMAFTWTLDETPAAARLPLGYLLAVEVGPHYGRPVERRSTAMARLRAYAFPDDREDVRDTDDDGLISEAEIEAGKRTAYF